MGECIQSSAMSRNIKFAPGEHYHIYNRGTEKRRIFTSKNDYERFLALMYVGNGTSPAHLQLQGRTLKELHGVERGKLLVRITAYCLMPNHFHLALVENEEEGISRFLQKLTTGYTMYFNRRNNRTGSLFQGTFKAKHADDDRYLKYLISYIHLNPLSLFDPKCIEGKRVENKKAARKHLEQYPYSSYSDYAGGAREETKLLDTSALPDYFTSSTDFLQELEEWAEYRQTFKV
jgi:putative transposase